MTSRACLAGSRTKGIARRRASITARASQGFTVERRISRNSARSALSSRCLEDSRIEFANLQIGFQLAYYRVRLFRLKAGGKGINVDTLRKAGGLLQRPVSHCLRCCSLPCIRSLPFRPAIPWLRVEVKLDKWMLMLNINRLRRLIINLTSDSKQTFHLCSSFSRLVFIYLLSRKLCNAFYLFTKANTHLPRRHERAFRVWQSHCTRVHSQPLYPRPPGEKGRAEREERERTAVLLGTPKL